MINEHFEPIFNAAMATQIVFQQPAKAVGKGFEVTAQLQHLGKQLLRALLFTPISKLKLTMHP